MLNAQYLVWAIVPIVVALGALRRHSKEALIFLAANPVMLVYSISHTLNADRACESTCRCGAPSVGEMAAAVLFSVAVAEHIRRLRRERERARREEAQAELLLKRRELETVLLRGRAQRGAAQGPEESAPAALPLQHAELDLGPHAP